MLPATELRRLLLARETTSVEIVTAALDRIAAVNPAVNAVCTLSERALDDARAADERLARGETVGLLHGLPVGIKDVTPTAGLRTTFGSRLYADHVPDEDALVVQRLKAAGAVVVGKTNTPEFAAGGNTYNAVFGRTRNPWNLERSAGGSSGGSAAALAAGMVALADGSDLGGSLRIPASFCGVVGLRTSPGLVPIHPSDQVWDTLDVAGPMARTVDDLALMLQAIAGPSPFSPYFQPIAGRDFGAAARAGIAGRRIAYAPDVAGIGVDAEIEKLCRRAALAMAEGGAVVEEVALDLSFARPAFLALRGLWMVAHHHPRLDRLGEMGENVAGNVRRGLATTVEELGAAEKARGRLWHRLRELFERYDQLLTPCMVIPPFPVEESYPKTVAGRVMETYVDWIAPTFVLSLSGLPVASVPVGLDGEGLPVGIQVAGRPQGEEGVLALARAIQEAHPVGSPPI